MHSWSHPPPREFSGIAHHSAHVRPGDVLVLVGASHRITDRALDQAQRNGAVAVVTDRQGACTTLPCLVSPHLSKMAHEMTRHVYRTPRHPYRTIAVTGTNGKSTVMWMCGHALHEMGNPSAMVGGLGVGLIGQTLRTATETTPTRAAWPRLLSDFDAQAGQSWWLSAEVSSQALLERRMADVTVQCGVFTGIRRDHLDLHRTMGAYVEAKAQLWAAYGLRSAVIWSPCRYAPRMASRAIASGAQVVRVKSQIPLLPGVRSTHHQSADVVIESIADNATGSCVRLRVGSEVCEALVRTSGRLSVASFALSVGALWSQGVNASDAVAALSNVPPPPGRAQVLRADDVTIVIDDAHTGGAAWQVMSEWKPQLGGRLVCVVGGGGCRPIARRQGLGRVCGQADVLIVTEDNSRTEDRAAIANVMAQSVRRKGGDVRLILDRQRAIEAAVASAHPGDVVLILGRGMEKWLDRGEPKLVPLHDADVASRALAARAR